MQPLEDTWTHAHDLALLFLALGYGTDQHLSDGEIDAIARALSKWRPDASSDAINEIVLESVAVFLESHPEKELIQSVRALRNALSLEKRQEALEDIMRIAEADGMLLNSEQNLLSILADIWDIRETKERLMEQTLATMESHPDWSLLHDLALIYIMMAHGSDEKLASEEIACMKKRLGGWAPDLREEAVSDVLREALQYYAADPPSEDLKSTIDTISKTFPRAQRLVVLSDLVAIAESDGPITNDENALIDSLSASWKIDVRVLR